jgi:CheY-like chemotaxis protein
MTEALSRRGLGWALAIAGPAGAACLGLLLTPLLDHYVAGPFLLAIAGAALLGGLGPGLLAVAVSAVAVNYWFFPRPDRLGFAGEPDLVAQAVFWAVALLVAAVCAWSRAVRLRAESEADRLGADVQAMRSRLTPELPPPALQQETRQAERESRPRPTTESQPTALVATDDSEARLLACHTLESAGFRWLSACDATEALELVDRYGFAVEVAVIEVLLPDMRGESLADRLIGRHANIAILYTSNVPYEELVTRGLLQPHEALLVRPFSADQLLNAVDEVESRRSDSEAQDAVVVSSVDR